MSTTHSTPTQKAFELGVAFATVLRHMYNHPEYIYLEPPTAVIAKTDFDRTPSGLYWTTAFIEKTYIDYVLPLLPRYASRKCKEIGNPWAYANPNYKWLWTWDAAAGKMKDADGNVIEFPTLPSSQLEENTKDIFSRNFVTKKIVLENETDPKAQALLGGRPFDFGEDAREAVRKLP